MGLYEELLSREIGRLVIERMRAESDWAPAVQTAALAALGEIQAVVQDDALSDFDALEEIVRVCEAYNIATAPRHDF